LSRFANCHDTNYGGDPDGDAQDREDASHLVSKQGN
jgi:hypothetical protein